MIGKVTRGGRVAGLLYYLYGPGRANEHVNPHVVAGFRHPAALEPKARPDGKRDFRHLTDVLNLPVETQRRRGYRMPVWQCSIRAAPGDRTLSDDEWAQVAEEVMHQTGIAPRADDDACRWVAVRHAEDHIHIVATLARQDGGQVSIHNDYYRVADACHLVEQQFQLTRTAPADKTAERQPTRAETERAARNGGQPPRVTLSRIVIDTAASSGSLTEFLTLLSAHPQIHDVRIRYSVRDPSQVTGYAVALTSHLDRLGAPVYYSGSKLAPDLSIPQLRRRFSLPADLSDQDVGRDDGLDGWWVSPSPGGDSDRVTLHEQVSRMVEEATRTLEETNSPQVRADVTRAAADLLHGAARSLDDPHLARAAELFERTARAPYRRSPQATRYGYALRRAARILAADARRQRRYNPAISALYLVAALIGLVQAIAELRETTQHAAQAAAARQTIEQLAIARRTLDPQSATAIPTATSNSDHFTARQLAQQEFPVAAQRALRARPHRRLSMPAKSLAPSVRPNPPDTAVHSAP